MSQTHVEFDPRPLQAHQERTESTTLGWGAIVLAAAALGTTACGVHDIPHEVAAVNTDNDLLGSSGPGGSSGNGITAGPVTTSTTTGTGGAGGASPPPPDAAPSGAGGSSSGDASFPTGSGGSMPARDSGMMVMDASGITVNIGGMNIPKENVIAFVMVGHSNMAGRATGPQSEAAYNLTQTDPYAWTYHVGSPVQPALEPRTAGDGGCTACGGPGTPLMKQLAAAYPGKYFVALGYGKNSAYCSQYLPGALFYDAAIAGPKAMKGRATFAAIVMMLGITERHGTANDINGYPNCINSLVTAIRNDVGEPNLPLLITDYEMTATGSLSTSSAFAQQIMPQIKRVPTVVSNSTLVPTEGLPLQDDHHFNFTGHKIWTGRVVQLIKDKGWDTWAR
jgi:hypothetical protein